MKIAFILLSFFASHAMALSVTTGEINGKTNLVTVGGTNVNGMEQMILADSAGLTLYTFAKDSQGVSGCTGGCLKIWPPLHITNGSPIAPPFAAIMGNDGQEQLTLKGLPLYHYNKDKKPGDAFGDYPDWEVIIVNPW